MTPTIGVPDVLARSRRAIGPAMTVAVDRLAPEIRRLVTEVCALPWAPSCLRFHDTNRSVGTASADQVRKPVFMTSVDRWRRHESRLAPLVEALGDLARN